MKQQLKVRHFRADGTEVESMKGVVIPLELSRAIAPLCRKALERKARRESRETAKKEA